MPEPLAHTQLEKVLGFIEGIGIRIIERELDDTFLPGLALGPNCIYVDYQKLLYPGDLLHEAGHLAVTEPHNRELAGLGKLEGWPTDGEEIAAVLWSYAALIHLGLPPDYVFHPNGYKNASAWLIKSFTEKNYIGLPLLEWMELTLSEEKAKTLGKKPFPAMQKWMRS